MSKVKITQEQADAIKKLKESIKANHEKFRSNHQCNLADWEYVLLDIPTEKYLNAIFEGYEVNSEFKAGDWVHRMSDKKIYRVEFVTEEGLVLDDESLWMFNEQGIDFKNYTQVENVRHATPEEIAEEKERRLFSRNGRKVWELRKRVQELEKDIKEWEIVNESWEEINENLAEQNKCYREALEKIVHQKKIKKTNVFGYDHEVISSYVEEVARKALEGEK